MLQINKIGANLLAVLFITAAGQTGLLETNLKAVTPGESGRMLLENEIDLDWETPTITSQTTLTMTWQGESVANISDQYNISVESLAEANDFPLTVGQTLTIPGAKLPNYAYPFLDPASTRVTQDFTGEHQGLDLAGPLKSEIVSVATGIVRYANWHGDYGNLVIIDHDNGYSSWYAHLDEINVSVGDLVEAGDPLGIMGETGNCSGVHLHFEVRYHNKAQDPALFLSP